MTIDPKTRTHDAGLNAAREMIPDADPLVIAVFAELIDRGLVSIEDLRGMVMRARATP